MRSERESREYELKLTGTAREMPAFKRAVNAAGNETQSWQSADLTTRYFDTPKQRLFNKGVALRVRQAKGQYLQTIKAERGGGGALDRAEWEQTVKKAEPDLKTIPKAARKKLGSIPEKALQPLMALEVRRQKTVIRRPSETGPDLEVEAVVDKGTVQAGKKTSRFSECELELLRGDPTDFFQLVTEIHDACPLRLSRTTKSDRGYALLNGRGVQSVKLPKFHLDGKHTISRSLNTIFEGCIGNIIDNEAAALDGKDPEGVHQLRVSVRRLRSVLSVFHRYITAERVIWLREELQWLGSSLGPAREWDVFITETLASVNGYGIDRRSLNTLAVLARRRRRAGYALVRTTIRSERYAKLLLRLTAFAATEGWLPQSPKSGNALLGPLGKHAASILDRSYRKLLKAGNGLKNQTPDDRHNVRIKLKKLRYAVDFLGNLYDSGNSRKFLKRLQQLQDQFGHLNDVAQAMHLIEELMQPEAGLGPPSEQARIAAGMVLGWQAHSLHAKEETLLEDWAAFRAVTPPWHESGAKP